ncbi:hypothetical protein HU200_035934 [Digitaria exilis]|uniref:Uncharacterized protein n=1 Tax=Digitaria exilis TaxID=1010633 RepID=A0A835BE51_9POAL|nr:hypothetical protein HU200_035934 [Digitaria exilis]
MSSMGKPAAAGTSCGVHRCISEFPSKCEADADRECAGLKSGGSHGCDSNCMSACGSFCPSGGSDACESTCSPICDKNCNDQEQPESEYQPCRSAVSGRCKNECEAGCKGGN